MATRLSSMDSPSEPYAPVGHSGGRPLSPQIFRAMIFPVVYDPHAFRGTASYYAIGRPAYSHELVQALLAASDLDGSGRLLDVDAGRAS